jgi:ABC-type transporter lipoprotein component MlaA
LEAALRTVYEEVTGQELRNVDFTAVRGLAGVKEAAIDPYVALRNAYAQYRQKMVDEARGKPTPPKPGGVGLGEATK